VRFPCSEGCDPLKKPSHITVPRTVHGYTEGFIRACSAGSLGPNQSAAGIILRYQHIRAGASRSEHSHVRFPCSKGCDPLKKSSYITISETVHGYTETFIKAYSTGALGPDQILSPR